MEADLEKNPVPLSSKGAKEMASKRKGIDAMESFSEQLENDLGNHRIPANPRIRGSRSNRVLRTHLANLQSKK